MKDILIIGAGALGKEVAQLIKDINGISMQWNFIGFIDETPEKKNTRVNNDLVLGGFEWFEKHPAKDIWAVCAIGNPRDKYSLVQKAKAVNLKFANLIHPSAGKNKFIEMGEGNIVCYHVFLSVNIKVGDHVVINPGCGIGHDTIIHDYATLYWDITLSGNVVIHEGCEIGSKAVVIPGKTVGPWSVMGAGAVVIDNLPGSCTAVGVPARIIKLHHEQAVT